MAITKPPVLPAWADAGDKVQPSNAELSVGWPVSSTPPSRQRFNWVLNYVANAVRYFSRRGLVDYDVAETYMTGDRVIGDDGKTYRSLIDNNTAQTPSTSPTKWERWGFSLADFGSNAQTQLTTAFTTAGAAPNFTLTPSPAIIAYAANQRFRAKFHAAGTGADVINLNALGNKSLKQYDQNGNKVAAVISVNQLADIEYDGIDFVILDPLPTPDFRHGQCRLVKSGANLVLQPLNGNKLVISGQVQAIPSAGIAITPASLPAKATGFVPTNLSAAAGTYTITTAAAHNLVAGDVGWVALSSAPAGTPQLAFNFTVATAPTGTSFTFVFGAATITAGAAGGSGGALIYHYAYMNAGVMAIESVATGHSTDATTGVEIKTGDATRTLVGMSIGGAFTDTTQAQYVRSWFNRAPIKGYTPLAAARSTASTTVVETNVVDRCQFLLWNNEYVHITSACNCYSSLVGALISLTAGFDGAGGVGVGTSIYSPVANYYSIIATYPIPIASTEGFHMVSPFIAAGAGTSSFASGGVSVWS